MAYNSVFANAYSAISQAATKSAFEQRFNAIQRGMISRLNDEIDDVVNDDTERRLTEIQDRRDELFGYAGKAREYLFGLETNKSRMFEISLDASNALSAAEADGDLASFTAEEAAALNEAKDFLVEKMRSLRFLYFPGDISDSSFVNQVQHDAQSLEALSAVAGTVDAEGTDPTTNDNRPLVDLLGEASNRAYSLTESLDVLMGAVNQLIIDSEKKMYGLEADLAEITAVEVQRKTEEIEGLKAKYGNLLRAISLSFEVSSSIGDMLVTGTTPAPDKTSILNLFV